MPIDVLATYLKMPKSSLYKQAQQGKTARQKIGKQWRFGNKAIDYWINESGEDQYKE
jgi:hypothetical protein